MPFDGLQTLAREQGFAAVYLLDASLASDAPEGISSLLLLLYPYDSWGKADPGCARISAYYFAAQDAYLKAVEMVRRLVQMGESARLCNDVRLKPLLNRLKDFTQGRNTLHYHREYGSRFHIQVIGLDTHYPMDEGMLAREGEENDMCFSCGRCLQACPACALTEEGFRREKCMRQHMMRGAPVPDHLRSLMGNRLLGCDICQQACPYNDSLKEEETAGECFTVEDLLKQDKGTLARLSEKIGRNMAIPNRVLSQAIIAAGNSGKKAYLPILDPLCHHPSQTVSEHAKWAVKKLSIGAGETTT
jgi:epoxyqueuosine reductase